jgi:hypothetical protein
VAQGALKEIRRSGLPFAGAFPYAPYGLSNSGYDSLARRIAARKVDILVVAAYLEDGLALRRAVVRAGIQLVASVGTSSSYCMHAFGIALGPDAVGLFASDKPEADYLNPDRLSAEAGEALRRAREEYRHRFGSHMTASALSGFAGAWALFRHVLPAAADLSPGAVAAAARMTRLPAGSLPNGSGLALAPLGHQRAGENLLAASVIWEWVRPGIREIVWPPAFATSPIVAVSPS